MEEILIASIPLGEDRELRITRTTIEQMDFLRVGNYLAKDGEEEQVLSGATFPPRFLPAVMAGLAAALDGPKRLQADIVKLLKEVS